MAYVPNATSVTNPPDAGVQASTAAAEFRTLKLYMRDVLLAGLNLRAPIANPTFTGTVSGITKSMVGLGNVDNTSDAAKPVSTAQQTALNLKANLASPTFTGTVSAPTFSGALSGNATTATSATSASSAATLSVARTISLSGVTATPTSFNGSANIAIPVTAVPASLLTGTVADANLPLTITSNITGNAGTATALQTARTIGMSGVTATATAFDGTGNILIPVTAVPTSLLTGTVADANLPATITSSITGNAATATALQTARTIDITGVTATATSFNGSANISIPITAVPATLITGTLANAQLPAAPTFTGLVRGNNGGAGLGAITVSTAAPSGGVDGDLWLQY